MSWKERYTPIKIGDMVELIKYGCNGDGGCCKENGYILGNKYKIVGVSFKGDECQLENRPHDCVFSLECVRKVFTKK